MTQTILNVGMAEMIITSDKTTVLTAPGLGSCIGVVMYDMVAKIGGLCHVVLPDSKIATSNLSLKVGKYADVAIPEMVQLFVKKGVMKSNILVKIAGGAQILTFGGNSNMMSIGNRNAIAVKEALKKLDLCLVAEDVGGNKGRTLKFDLNSGKVYVRSIGDTEKEI